MEDHNTDVTDYSIDDCAAVKGDSCSGIAEDRGCD